MRFALLTVLTIFAAWLRFSAVDFGLPDHVRPDEEFLVSRALDFHQDWNPHWSIYPAAQTYLVHGVLRSYAMLSGAKAAGLQDVYAANNDRRAYAIARRVTAAMGTATVPIIYLAAMPVFGEAAALTASAIVAVSFIHIRESKFAKDEIPAAFWLALSLMMMLRVATRGRLMDYAMAGLFCGLAAATHYPAGAVSIGILVAHLEGRRREGHSIYGALLDSRIYLAGMISIVAFLCADPYFILDWPQTVAGFADIRADYTSWNPANTPAGYGWPWLMFWAMPASFGIALEIFMLAAMAWMIWCPRPGTWALLAFIAVCFLSLTNGHPQIVFRYMVNPLLAMALLGGLFAADIFAMFRSRLGTVAVRLLVLLAGGVLLLPSAIRDVEFDRLLDKPDTRTIAREWITRHIAPGNSLVLLFGGDSCGKPQISDHYLTYPLEFASLMPAPGARVSKWIVADSFPPLSYWSKGISNKDAAKLTSEGTLEFDLNPLKPGAATSIFDPNDAFFAPFDRIGSMSNPGPRIRIWKLSEASDPKFK